MNHVYDRMLSRAWAPAEVAAWKAEYHSIRGRFAFSPRIQAIARSIRLQLPTQYAAVHVRRGDKVGLIPFHDRLTKPGYVWAALRREFVAATAQLPMINATILVMTDEPAGLGFFQPFFSRKCPSCVLIRAADFPEAVGLENYMLFWVECALLAQATIRVGTWKGDLWPGSPGVRQRTKTTRRREADVYVTFPLLLAPPVLNGSGGVSQQSKGQGLI